MNVQYRVAKKLRALCFGSLSLVTISVMGAIAGSYEATDSIATLQGYGEKSAAIAYAHVAAYYAGGVTGGGDFHWVGSCPGKLDAGTKIGAANVAEGCWVREISGPLDVYMFGAKGMRQKAPTDCSVQATKVTCADVIFVPQDIGNLASFYLAGASHAGGRNWTHNTTIVAVAGHVATLAAPAPNSVARDGVFAFGPDDSAAMNAALAANGATSALQLTAPGYMVRGTFKIGNNSPTWTHNIHGAGNPTIYCYILNASNHSDVDCVQRLAFNDGRAYLPSYITGGITFDSMNNGRDGFVDMGGYNVYQTNVSISRSYRNCWARIVSDSAFIQQYTAVNTNISACGLHGILNWTNDNQPYNGFIDEFMHVGLDIEGWGYNSGQFGVRGDEMGAAIYSVNTGSAAQNFILGHTFLGPLEFNSNRGDALAYGTDQNANAVFFADGQQPNLLFGGCVAAPCSRAMGFMFKRWYFESPTIECSAGCSQSAKGALFAFQTKRLTPNAMRFQDLVTSGSWTDITKNISFGLDCSVSGNGCGNFLSQANQGTPTESRGYKPAALP